MYTNTYMYIHISQHVNCSPGSSSWHFDLAEFFGPSPYWSRADEPSNVDVQVLPSGHVKIAIEYCHL